MNSAKNIFKEPRPSTRAGRASASRRAELEEERRILSEVLRLSAAAGRTVAEPFASVDPMSKRQLQKEERALREEAGLLDRRVEWSAPELFVFLGEPELGLNETRAERAEKIVKRVKARLVRQGHRNGAGLFDGGDGSIEWPSASGGTTYGFAYVWARRVGFVAPRDGENREAEEVLRKIDERRRENDVLEAERRAAKARATRVRKALNQRAGSGSGA